MNRIELGGFKTGPRPRCLPVGGLAILIGLMRELNVADEPQEGAPLPPGREVYDMLHRSDAPADDDPRMVTVSRMQHRYGVDTEQARRVAAP